MNSAPERVRPRLRSGRLATAVLGFLIGVLVGAFLARSDIFSAGPHVLRGSGIAVTQTRHVPSFTAVDLAGSNVVTIRVGDRQSVAVHGDDNLIGFVTTRVVAGTLVISDTRSFSTNASMDVNLTVPSLSMLKLSGSGTVSATHVRSARFTVALSGSGIVRASGSAAQLSVTVGGSGEALLFELVARDARAVIGGSGEVRVTATHSLSAAVPGSGVILYAGTPAHVIRSVSGSGAIVRSG